MLLGPPVYRLLMMAMQVQYALMPLWNILANTVEHNKVSQFGIVERQHRPVDNAMHCDSSGTGRLRFIFTKHLNWLISKEPVIT
ncbi:hypothetical protein scyTo_0005021 [Scyliorhinus torazame]|uniref:Uncharacterized protein n=1 Tax=Scyliorhinus torazame TaxID=75743 RepID=A0A401P0V5_SCYTO|nr:hypothetical protein [Scyliorhinus torazame]